MVSFTIVPTDTGGRATKELRLRLPSGATAALPVTPEMDMRPSQSFVLDTPDIDFDGASDLMLMTSIGTSNAEAEYWIYDPKRAIYVDQGVFPELRPDPVKHELNAHEDDGEAGQLFHDTTYGWRAGKLVKIREVKQVWGPHHSGLLRIISERRGNAWVVVSSRPASHTASR
jgi:hypothetical protein